MAARFGSFLLFIAVFLLGLFVLTVQAANPQFGYFAGSVVSFILGLLLRRNKVQDPPPAQSGRFRLIKSIRTRSQSRQSEEDDE